MNQIFTYKEFQLEYITIGNGAKPMLAFHGFGQGAEVYEHLLPSLGNDFTIYSFNIFFHGKSVFPKHRVPNEPLKRSEWIEIIDAFVKEKSLPKFSLIGYSLGGKLAMNLVVGLAEKIDRIILIAPDGLKIYPLNYISTRSKIVQKLFLRVIEHPGIVFKTMSGMKKLGMIDNRAHDFFTFQISQKWRRELTYDVWMTMKYMNPNLEKISALINKHEIKTILIFGKHDTIIKPYLGKRFASKIKNAQFIEVSGGHNLVTEKLNAVINELYLR